MPMRMFGRLCSSEAGSSLIEVAVAAPVLLLLTLGVVEFGRAAYLQNELVGAAQAGAIYASQNPTDISGAETVARQNAADVSAAADISNFAATASWGCECSDGTGAKANCSSTPTCATNVVDYSKVIVSATYSPFFKWPQLPASLPLSATATMRSAQ